MLGQIFISASHLNKFFPQNIKMHVYEHRQAADRREREADGKHYKILLKMERADIARIEERVA